jgi:L-ascorbate metabolism protein UlaG (beta-lactamase superfamily)
VRITHLGHSCLLVEAADQRLLIDPGTLSHGFEELTGLSAVLVTHEHPDHLDVSRLPTLLEANDEARLLAEPETAVQLSHSGLNCDTLHVGEPVAVGGMTVTPLGGNHATIHPDVPVIGNVGLLIEADGEPRLFVPGDSYAVTPDGIDLLGLPLAAPWASAAMTVDFTRAVGASTVFPLHDESLSPLGRTMLLGLVDRLSPQTTRLVDLKGAGPTDF